MSKTIGAGALPRQIPQVLDAVEAGDRYTITRRSEATAWKDVPVAVLLPASSFAERLSRLSEDDLDFLLGEVLSSTIDGRAISPRIVEHAKQIHDRLQGDGA